MFKPLLRTLPSLSGNFTVACKLNEIEKDSSNEYHTYVRKAKIMPLQNIVYDKNIELNLLNGKYEFDVQKFHYAYSNIFYNENFSYNKKNYKELDLDNFYDSYNDSRNKDYEFGCKRIKYSQSQFQFSFYAPFYLDDINDLPKYFCIHIKLNDHLVKKIKIYFNDNTNKTNYLLSYLTRYYKQIDDKVIFCLPNSLQATYFGIDIKKGGLVQYIDNEIGNLYINQTTINNFDNIICKGFERNNLIMSQIFPISFMFNLNDIFSSYEKEFFAGTKINISGYYCNKNDILYDFYDFDVNYTNSYLKYYKYNEFTGKYEHNFGLVDNNQINIMNVGYPALNESKYIKYAYTNKITPNYCKFKMLLSPDDDPYITNLNFAYSYLQMPNNKYGYFPTTFTSINPQAYIKESDLKLPIGNDKQTYYETVKYFANKLYIDNTNINKYIKLMSNYYSTWYNVDENLNIFDDDTLWSNVKYDYAYHKGILYNFNELKKYGINKFGVFLHFDFNFINEDILTNNLIKAKCVLSTSDISPYLINYFNNAYNMKHTDKYNCVSYSKIYDLNISSNKQSYVLFDKIMKHDSKGKYIEEKNYISENIFYKYEDVEKFLRNYINDEDFFIMLSETKIKGYILLDPVNNINFFETYYDIYGNNKKRIILKDLFESANINSKYYWLYDSLYYSDNIYVQKIKLNKIYNIIDFNESTYNNFAIYLEKDLIHLNDIYNLLYYKTNEEYEINGNNTNNYLKYIKLFTNLNINQTYIYERYGERNGVILNDYFVKNTKSYTDVYVDTYNLNNLISLYNKYAVYNSNFKKINKIKDTDKTIEKFIKIINKDHLIEYYNNLNKDENNYSSLNFKSLLDILYVKQRYWVIDDNNIINKDIYVTLHNFLLSYPIYYDNKYKNSNDSNTYININNYDIYNEHGILNSTEYENFLNKASEIYTDEYIELWKNAQQYIQNVYNNYSNDQILDWLCENISDTRNNNYKFNFNLFGNNISIDLCFKKQLVLLNNNLINLLNNDNKSINYLYLYINSNCLNENYDTWPIISSNQLNNTIHRDIDDYLVPLFTSPYINDTDINTELAMISNNKIKNNKYIYDDGTYFKEIDILETMLQLVTYNDLITNDKNIENKWYEYILNKIQEDNLDNELFEQFAINSVIDKTNEEINQFILYKLNFLYEYFNDYFYDVLVKSKNITLYSIYDILNIKYNTLENKLKDVIYDNQYNMYIYNHNGITYGFYYMQLNIDNSNNSFNIINDYNLNVIINSINNVMINNENKKYFNSIFYLLHPLLKVNIFNDFSRNTSTIIYPHEAEILIKYVQLLATKEESKKYSMLKDSLYDKLYSNIVQLYDVKKIKLLRYFNYISPLLKKTSIIKDVWKFKFLTDTPFKDINKQNIFYKEDINIYKYDQIHVYSGNYDKTTYEFDKVEKISQYEYKHFNDNLLFNLPEEILIDDKKYYTSNDIKLINEDSNLLKEKKLQILLKYFRLKGFDYMNIILFLYNKYESSIYIEKNKLNSNKTDYKYKISYKFKLV